VRHVSEKLGLVFAGERELLRLVFERLPRLLDFRILALHFLILVRQQLGLFLQFLVGLLQLLLPAAQLLGERLRLRQQILRAHVRFDGIDHDADTFHQLLEERLVGMAEPLERSQFDHAFQLTLKDDGQDEHDARRGAAESRADAYVIGRHILQQDFLLGERALAEQPLAQV